MKPTRVCLLDGGSLAIDGYKVYWNRGPSGDIRFPVYSVLIDHEDGLFIYDTGFDLLHMQTYIPGDQPLQTPDQPCRPSWPSWAQAVRRDGYPQLAPAYRPLRGARVLPQGAGVLPRRRVCAGAEAGAFERMSYSDLSFDPGLEARGTASTSGARATGRGWSPKYKFVRGDQVAKGVKLIETLGHSAGHYSLLVELEGRKPCSSPATQL